MEIVKRTSQDYTDIEEILGENPDATQLEMLAGIDCDAEDIEAQRQAGEEDPMAAIELIAQWNPDTKEGILDWYFARESTIDDDEPAIEHGGPLFAFRFTSDEPDLEMLIEKAVPALSEAVEWAEFTLDEEE
ncbi:hypothetical protein ACFPK9_15760 [Rubritalea spongiae]|uniref:Uncharacterized protein n=1 Tax=Rubritalea spongiae TaxID=430797 RepID=A0ABW5DWX6_9BACT